MDPNTIKKIVIVFLSIMQLFSLQAQYQTIVDVEGIANKSLQKTIEDNSTKLLSEINFAFFNNKTPDFSDINISSDAKSSILAMWETSPFRCIETEIINNILNLNIGGYELRDIRIYIKEADSIERNQESVLVYKNSGEIDNFYIAINKKNWKRVMTEGSSITDLRRREIILNFVENFRTSYNRKDISLLEKVFSDDALIITGKVIKVKSDNSTMLTSNLSNEQIIYTKQNKSEYLNKLKTIFSSNQYINIKFEELKVTQHKLYPEIYGVTIKQYWNTSRYSDVGYVFLLIDFSDDNNPIIHVRTWQPDKIGGEPLPEDSIFSLGNFGNYNRE